MRSGSAAQSDAQRQAELGALLMRTTIGEYEILGELGRGGMATVYLAHELALDRRVAIKVVAPALTAKPDLLERFKREARTAAGLSHPHIIPIHSVRESAELLFFVMKFVDGRALDEIIRSGGPLPIRMVQAILLEVGQALAYAHRRGVVHRDVKPANIMLDGEGYAVVMDFGIAKPLQADTLTASGAMIGTPFYMSPEQFAGKMVDGASDQYSLGVVAYQMLTGHRPFAGDTIMEIMKGHFFEVPSPILEARSDCPPELAAVVDRMLAKEPAARFATLDEALQAMACAPLPSDDPVRSQMIELARSNEALERFGNLRVPMSPVPRARAALLHSRDRAVSGAGGARPTGERRRSLGIVALVLFGVVLGAAAVVSWMVVHPALRPPVAEGPEAGAAQEPGAAPAALTAAPAPGPGTVLPDSASLRPDSAPTVTLPAAAPPKPPSPTPAELRARRQADLAAYAGRLEREFNRRWAEEVKEDIEVDRAADFEVLVQPNGAVPDLPPPPGDGPLADRAALVLAEVSGTFDPLPASAGSRPIQVRITFTAASVRVRIP